MIGVDGQWGFLVICECGVLSSFCGRVQRLMVLGCVQTWEACSNLVLLIYETSKKKKKTGSGQPEPDLQVLLPLLQRIPHHL